MSGTLTSSGNWLPLISATVFLEITLGRFCADMLRNTSICSPETIEINSNKSHAKLRVKVSSRMH